MTTPVQYSLNELGQMLSFNIAATKGADLYFVALANPQRAPITLETLKQALVRSYNEHLWYYVNDCLTLLDTFHPGGVDGLDSVKTWVEMRTKPMPKEEKIKILQAAKAVIQGL